MGRQTKLTPEVQERIVRAIRSGNYAQVAAAGAGIDKSTYWRWMADERPLYRAFRDAVEKADADAEARNIALVQQAAPKNWQAAAWYLERKHFDRWGRREKQDIEGKLDIAVIWDEPPGASDKGSP